MTKSTTIATPAPAEAKPLTRSEVLTRLGESGYEGPTSFTMTTLREVLAWVESGSKPEATNIPAGVIYSVHPDLKPAARAKAARLTKFDQGYQQALAEVAELKDLAGVKAWVSANVVKVEA